MDPKQQYISELSKTRMYEAAHEVSSCSLWSTPSGHSDIYAALIGHHHLAHEHTQMQHAKMQHAKMQLAIAPLSLPRMSFFMYFAINNSIFRRLLEEWDSFDR